MSSLCHGSLYLVETGLVEGLPAARVVTHVVGHAAVQPVGVADPTLFGKVLQHTRAAEGKGCALLAHKQRHLWFGFCSFCWLELLFFAFKTHMFMSQWRRVTLGSRCARLNWVILHPLTELHLIQQAFSYFWALFVFLITMICLYGLTLDTNPQIFVWKLHE